MTSASKSHPYEVFLPSTFEERGTSVPFNAPVLAYARVRKNDRRKVELCVAGFAGSAGIYVIPWHAVRDISSLTVHDLELHEEIITSGALDPHAMRVAALRVAAKGLAGVAAAKVAVAALAADEEMKALNQVVLMLRVIEEFDPAAAPNLLQGITTPQGQEQVRGVLAEIAGRLGIKPEIFDDRLGRVGIGTYAVGVPWSPVEGRLRQILRRVGELVVSLALCAKQRLNEAGSMARFCATVAHVTHGIGTQLLGELDALLADPRAIVVSWEKKRHELDRLTDRLAWLLDGWEPICQRWSSADGESSDGQAAILQELLPVLPLVPRDELEVAKRLSIAGMAMKNRRLVRLYEDWLTGDLIDLVEQLQTGNQWL